MSASKILVFIHTHIILSVVSLKLAEYLVLTNPEIRMIWIKPLVFENIRIAFQSIRGNLVRSVLTILIIAVGISALVGILTAIDSIKNSITPNSTTPPIIHGNTIRLPMNCIQGHINFEHTHAKNSNTRHEKPGITASPESTSDFLNRCTFRFGR